MTGPTAADLHLQTVDTLNARVGYLAQQVRALQAEVARLKAENEKTQAPPTPPARPRRKRPGPVPVPTSPQEPGA